jgi:hypothetical protein
MAETQRIGLIAGSGESPVYFARKAAQKGIRVVAIAFSKEIGAGLIPYAEKNYAIGIGQTGKIFQTLKNENIRDIIIMGKVDKGLIFKPQLFDLQAIKFLAKLKNQEDKTVMVSIIQALEDEGFHVLDQRECLREIFPAQGVLTRRKPSGKEMEDVEFGLPIVRAMADMEIGQTLVVKNKTVVAVEAVEGTDAALLRGCELSRGECVAIKFSRTHQDYRYDCPGIGPDTIRVLAAGRARVLAVEAERIMIINQSEVVRLADEAGITVLSV